jgi:hypothetical protein
MDREVWFKRIAWSYFPIHWKGWVCTAFLAATGSTAMAIALELENANQNIVSDMLPLIIVILVVTAGSIIASRHS